MHGFKIFALLSLSSTMVSGSKRKLSTATPSTNAYAKQYCTGSRDRPTPVQDLVDVPEQALEHEAAQVKTDRVVPLGANAAHPKPFNAKAIRTYNLQPQVEPAKVIAVQSEGEIFSIFFNSHRQDPSMGPPPWVNSASPLIQGIYARYCQDSRQMLYPHGPTNYRLADERAYRATPTGKVDEPKLQDVHKILDEWKEHRTRLGGPVEPFVARPVTQSVPLASCQVSQQNGRQQNVQQNFQQMIQQNVQQIVQQNAQQMVHHNAQQPNVSHAARNLGPQQVSTPDTPPNPTHRHGGREWEVPELYWAMYDFDNPVESIIPILDGSVRSCAEFRRVPESYKYCQPEPPRGPSRYDRSNPTFDSSVFLV